MSYEQSDNYNHIDNVFLKNIFTSNQDINNIHITSREFDILACLIGSCSSKKTALLLSVSPKTVENHIRNIMLKFNCSSRDNVINYIEKSIKFSILKEHYVNILINNAFERELKKIADFFKNKHFNIVKLYYPKEQEQKLFKLQLEKHLKLVGIAACHIEFIEQSNDDCINAINQENYYLLTFDILKKILPDCNIEKNIEEFKRQYNIFNPSFVVPVDSKLLTEKTNISNNFKYYNIILIMFTATVILLFGLFILYIDKKTKHSEYNNLQRNLAFPNDIVKEQIIFGVPPRNKNFTDRQAYLTKIQEQLNKQQFGIITQTISGLGGIGKTQLATEFAYIATEKKQYKIILWIAAEKLEVMSAAYKKIAANLQIDTENLNFNQLKKLVHEYLAVKYKGCKILFILDNVENFNEISNYIDSLREQLANQVSLELLITSRAQDWPESPLILDTFTPLEALNFIKKRLPGENEESCINLAKNLNYFPLALSQAVAYIKNHTNIDNYLTVYTGNAEKYLDTFSNNYDQYNKSLWQTWNITLDKLSKNGKKIISIAAYLEPDNIPIEFFSDFTIDEKMEAIEDLRKHSLIMLVNNNKAFKIHRLMQQVIQLTQKSGEHGILANAINLLDNKFDCKYLEINKANLWEKYLIHAKMLAQYAINDSKLFDLGVQLYAKIAMFMTHIIVADPEATSQVWEKLLELIKKYNNNRSNLLISANINVNLGFVLRHTNKENKAKICFDKAIAIYKQDKTTSITRREKELLDIFRVYPLSNNAKFADIKKYDMAVALISAGSFFNASLRNPKMAVLYYQEALKIFSELETIDSIKNSLKYEKSYALRSLGLAYMYLDELVLAEKALLYAKEIMDQIYCNHREQASLYKNLGRLYMIMGKYKEADQMLKNSINIFSTIFPDKHCIINSIKTAIGYNTYLLGDIKNAKILLEEATDAWNNIDGFNKTWFPKLYLARVYEKMGDYNKALKLMRESLIDSNKHKPYIWVTRKPNIENWILSNGMSINYLKTMLDLNIKFFNADHYRVARYHCLLGQALFKLNNVQLAMEQYKKSLVILKNSNLLEYYQPSLELIQNLIKKCTN